MATIEIGDGVVTLALSGIEEVEGFHGQLHAPLSAVRQVRAVDDAWPELRGIRAPGTGIPDVIAVGTRRGSFGRDFAAVHGRGPGVVVEFDGYEFSRWVFTTDRPEQLVETVRGAMSGAGS